MSSRLTTEGLHPNGPFGTQNRMSPTLALIWKQCADLFQSFAVLSLASIATLMLIAWLMRDPLVRGPSRYYWLSLSSVGLFSCGFALVACFVSFVTEHESRTREFLTNLPVSSFLVGGVKQLGAALAVAVFFGVQVLARLMILWLCQNVFQLQAWPADIQGPNPHFFVAIIVTMVFVSCLISCSFWSTSWTSVFIALPLAWFLCAACVSYGSSLAMIWNTGEIWGYPRVSKVLLALSSVAAVAVPLFWLRRRPLAWKKITMSDTPLDEHDDDFFYASLPSRMGIPTPAWLALPGRDRFPALCWQSVRQQAMLPFLAMMAIGVLAWLFYLVLRSSNVHRLDRRAVEAMRIGLVFVMTITGYGFGWGAIYRDKLNSNLNFFQQHIEHGRELLLARVLFPAFLSLITLAVGSGVIYLLTGHAAPMLLPLFAGLAAFSATLMWSMTLRSYIYALGIGLVLSMTMNAVIVSWLTKSEPAHLWMIVLPLFWLATCFAYAPTWLSSRRTARWMAWFIFVSMLTFAVPLWKMACWMMGVDSNV